MSKKKLVSSVIAVALAVGILLGGTFAWQSISQEALNEVYGFINPGGRLHDDFHEVTDPEVDTTRRFDKNVYVENFTKVLEDGVQIFARIRLDEYMEIGPGAGADGSQATPVVYGTELGDKDTWVTYVPDNNNDFREYWDWTMAGDEDESVYYMPTFNKNKDSLEADVNGSFVGIDGDYKTGTPFDDYVEWTENAALNDTIAVYDADDNDVDEIVLNNYTADYAAQNGFVKLEEEDHHTKLTGDGQVITMAQWQALPDDEKVGSYWVWDEDGWAYWAMPIDPNTATGLFLDGIARTEKIINEEWYYGINVVAQFITGDDLGRDDSTGFYDINEGKAPSYNALKLLAAIGVKVETAVVTADDLAAAVAVGGMVTLQSDVTLDSVLTVDKDVVINMNGYDIEKSAGNTVFVVENGAKLTVNGSGTETISVANDEGAYAIWSIGDGTQANEVVLNDVNIEATTWGVYHAGNDYGAHLTINNSTIKGGDAGVYLSGTTAWGENKNSLTITGSTITGGSAVEVKHGNVTVTDSTLTTKGTLTMVSNGNGTCSGGYALALTNSGTEETVGAFIVNSGTFTGAVGIKDANPDASITIKGGTFSENPGEYVAEGYTVTANETDGVTTYTVNPF